ncbi:Uma2 family endonuclease [Clostridium punense]|uniref:Uma2 family endonuclease n=1 Tax=Clostridium punense TaxID=1054297 RepID=A0ABS4K088_9CLOT|nr:Uma2 family endonuclease [Clostridium punense]MBP2021202.1 Uma2 family endonuclease [Clostridium punense]
MRNYIENIFYTEDEFEEIQANFNGKAEYDNGVIYLSSNTSQKHNIILNNINAYLTLYFRGKDCRSYTEQIEVIFKSENDIKKYKPDIFVMCGNVEQKGESFLTAPKIIFEILSKSTSKIDRGAKYYTYEKYGVLEYNIVDQNGFIVQHTLIDGAYEITNTFKKGDKYISSIFTDLIIDVGFIFSE